MMTMEHVHTTFLETTPVSVTIDLRKGDVEEKTQDESKYEEESLTDFLFKNAVNSDRWKELIAILDEAPPEPGYFESFTSFKRLLAKYEIALDSAASNSLRNLVMHDGLVDHSQFTSLAKEVMQSRRESQKQERPNQVIYLDSRTDFHRDSAEPFWLKDGPKRSSSLRSTRPMTPKVLQRRGKRTKSREEEDSSQSLASRSIVSSFGTADYKPPSHAKKVPLVFSMERKASKPNIPLAITQGSITQRTGDNEDVSAATQGYARLARELEKTPYLNKKKMHKLESQLSQLDLHAETPSYLTEASKKVKRFSSRKLLHKDKEVQQQEAQHKEEDTTKRKTKSKRQEMQAIYRECSAHIELAEKAERAKFEHDTQLLPNAERDQNRKKTSYEQIYDAPVFGVKAPQKKQLSFQPSKKEVEAKQA